MNPRLWLLLPSSLLLAGCLNGTASLRLGGNDHGLTLQARQPYFWSQAVELEVVMSRQPDCHRRSRLEGATLGDVTVDVLRPEEGAFAEPILILKQGTHFYAVSTKSCEMQKFKAPPDKPGTRLGTFQREGERGLKFAAAPATSAANPPASPPPAAQSQQ
jgi:hypothetical protein